MKKHLWTAASGQCSASVTPENIKKLKRFLIILGAWNRIIDLKWVNINCYQNEYLHNLIKWPKPIFFFEKNDEFTVKWTLRIIFIISFKYCLWKQLFLIIAVNQTLAVPQFFVIGRFDFNLHQQQIYILCTATVLFWYLKNYITDT